MTSTENNNERTIPKTPLTQFIDENSKLFSALRLFVALSVFARNLPEKEISEFLSFLLLSLSFCVFIQIVDNLRWFDEFWTVRLFGNLLFISMMGFVYFWIKTYQLYLRVFMFMALMLFLCMFAFGLGGAGIRRILRLAWFKRINERAREQLIPMLGAMCLVVLALAVSITSYPCAHSQSNSPLR